MQWWSKGSYGSINLTLSDFKEMTSDNAIPDKACAVNGFLEEFAQPLVKNDSPTITVGEQW